MNLIVWNGCMSKDIPLIILLKKMDQALQKIGPIEVNIQEKKVSKFYEITKATGAPYLKENIISPEYFMTLLAPIATKIFLKIMNLKDLPKINGIIHTQSEINFLKPLSYGSYLIISQMEKLQKKKGKIGSYLVMTFRMSLINQQGDEIANDIHQFFLRLKEEED